MKIIVTITLLFFSFFGISQQKTKVQLAPFSVKDKIATVYTSADSTSLRLTKTDNLKFSELRQPLETQVCVFVNPGKTFQTFLGIGGAITDASAEVFAKLPADKQQEFLNAYFNDKNGIGYTLIRTNIHSCDFSSA